MQSQSFRQRFIRGGSRSTWALILLVLLLGSCSGADQLPVTLSTEATNEITVYTSRETASRETANVENLLARFRQANPTIQVNIVIDGNGALTQRLIDERDDPQADVIWGMSASSVLVAEWMQMLRPYAPAGMQRIDPRFRDSSNPPYWVGMSSFMSAFCVNPTLLAAKNLPIPHSWSDLLNPVYKQQIVIGSPLVSGSGFIVTAGMLELWGETNGWAYLEALHQNVLHYAESSSNACRLVGQGKYAIVVTNQQAISQKLAGQPIEVILPSEGSGWDIQVNALVRKRETNPAAKLFLDWAISDEAMRLYAESNMIPSVTRTSRRAQSLSFSLSQLIDEDIPWVAANREHILSEWQERFGEKLEQVNQTQGLVLGENH